MPARRDFGQALVEEHEETHADSHARQSPTDVAARIGIVLALLAAVLVMSIARMDLVERTIQGETTTFTVPSWH